MRVQQRVSGRLPADLARAAVLAASLRPPVLAAQTAILLGCTLLSGTLGGPVAALATAVTLIVVFVLQRPLAIASLGRALPARGYRPGETLTLDWSPTSFTFTTARGESTYRHDEVAWQRRRGRAVVLFVAEAKLLVILPAAMVDAARSETAPSTSAG